MKNNHIDYIEFKANDLELIKKFYSVVFNWEFTDYGPTYTSFSADGMNGGFEKTDEKIVNGALIVLYHEDLELIKKSIVVAGGKIEKDVFSFPGGSRFEFSDSSGNILAVWSDK